MIQIFLKIFFMEKKIIISIVAIIVILAAVFLSQQAFFKNWGKGVSTKAADSTNSYLTKASNLVSSKVLPTISGEVQKRGDIIKNEVSQEKQKISENIGTKIKNYFSGVVDNIFHPAQNKSCTQNCQPSQTQPKP